MLVAGHRPNREAWAGLGAQLALAGGLLIYLVRADWMSSANGIFTLVFGILGLVAGTWLWWQRRSRVPIMVVDVWLATYGAFLLLLYTSVDRAAGPVDQTLLVLGSVWLLAGVIGVYSVWNARSVPIRR